MSNNNIEIATISYQDLIPSKRNTLNNSNGNIASSVLQKSFQQYGIVFISNIPKFCDMKQSLLPMAHRIARCTPKEYLEKELTDVKSFYNAGWSHGKEKLGKEADVSKGSFYYNPITDTPGSQNDRDEYPCSYPCNIWPKDSIVPGFESLAKDMGRLMHHVATLVSRHIDEYTSDKIKSYPDDLLYNSLKDTEKVKCRLLYYYPIEGDVNEDSWIGWHNDSGFLTALAGDLYVDDTTGLPILNPDPDSGLHITTSSGSTHSIQIPSDCMAIQIGECTQIITGGMVRSTPHCVKGSSSCARISMACFVDAVPGFRLSAPEGCQIEDVINCPSKKVPPLEGRWTDGITFGEFLDNTFRRFYDW